MARRCSTPTPTSASTRTASHCSPRRCSPRSTRSRPRRAPARSRSTTPTAIPATAGRPTACCSGRPRAAAGWCRTAASTRPRTRSGRPSAAWAAVRAASSSTPRAQAFQFGLPAADAIFACARDARVPILIHAGRGMAPMDALADLALRYPEVALVLAHAGIAGQGMFASRLAEHPSVVYDTSTLSPFDVIELFARVPAERIVFASDVPYGRPAFGLYQALRIGTHVAGLDAEELRMLAGGTMTALLGGSAPRAATAPRVPEVRPVV